LIERGSILDCKIAMDRYKEHLLHDRPHRIARHPVLASSLAGTSSDDANPGPLAATRQPGIRVFVANWPP